MLPEIKVTAIDHHRNGISGAPFYIILFESENKNMMGIVFDETSYVAVFDKDLISKNEIRFAYNSWRGDNFEPQLRVAIEQFESGR